MKFHCRFFLSVWKVPARGSFSLAQRGDKIRPAICVFKISAGLFHELPIQLHFQEGGPKLLSLLIHCRTVRHYFSFDPRCGGHEVLASPKKQERRTSFFAKPIQIAIGTAPLCLGVHYFLAEPKPLVHRPLGFIYLKNKSVRPGNFTFGLLTRLNFFQSFYPNHSERHE